MYHLKPVPWSGDLLSKCKNHFSWCHWTTPSLFVDLWLKAHCFMPVLICWSGSPNVIRYTCLLVLFAALRLTLRTVSYFMPSPAAQNDVLCGWPYLLLCVLTCALCLAPYLPFVQWVISRWPTLCLPPTHPPPFQLHVILSNTPALWGEEMAQLVNVLGRWLWRQGYESQSLP